MTSRIRISQPELGDDVERLVLEVLRSGRLAQGPMVARFEALCAAMAGTRHAVALSNGTVALEAALDACGVGPGDEVITSPFTFAATINAVLRSGAVVRFADIGDDYTITAESADLLVTAATKVVMPVHLYGLMADMGAIDRVARRHGLRVIEDAAQAHGATLHGRAAGSFGLGCFSFYATKNVTSGEGGCVTCDDDRVADDLRVLRNQGMRERYRYERIGENWRLTEVAAAIAIPQLERLDVINKRRGRNASLLSELLAADPRIALPKVPEGRTHVWHQYTVLLPEEADRGAVAARLDDAGIDAGIYYPSLVWDHDAYRAHPNVRRDPTPHAERVARRCLSLPVHPGVDERGIARVATALLAALDTAA